VRVLVLNAGSVTLKGTVLDVPGREPLVDRTIDWGSETGSDRAAGLTAMLDGLAEAGIAPDSIEAVGHRVVHGGEQFTEPVAVDDRVVEALEALDDLAPLHNPPAIETMRAALDALPDPVHVAAFDTAFHATLPEPARRYPVPDRWVEEWGVRRYGFHGLSIAWSLERAGELLRRSPDALRLVVAHLGGGASVTAVEGGRSVDTSMGLTPLEGLMMATRSGSIDPGAILRVLRAGHPLDAVAEDLERRSGLRGVSGRSSDMRELLRAEDDGDQRASLAIELFVRRAAAGIAAAATSLQGIDALVFTGGIGEHASGVRARIVERLTVLGPSMSVVGPEPAVDGVLAAGPPALLRIHAREDVVIAKAAASLAGARY
jgi:acetate kinase